jgi:hypothetical protein
MIIGHVTDQDPDDAQGKMEVGGHLGDGQDVVAEGGDGPLLHGQLRRLLPNRGGGDQRLHLQVVVGGPGAPASHRMGPDPSPLGSWLPGSVHLGGLGGTCRGQGSGAQLAGSLCVCTRLTMEPTRVSFWLSTSPTAPRHSSP